MPVGRMLSILAVTATIGAGPAIAEAQTQTANAGKPEVFEEFSDVNIIGGRKMLYRDFARISKWERVRPEIDANAKIEDPKVARWVSWARGLRDLAPIERLRAIHDGVQQKFRYVTDTTNWNQPDYWETPEEIVERGAMDCEGFAIFKFFLAVHAGIDPETLIVLAGVIPSTREGHAVLVTRTRDGERDSFHILDNRLRHMLAIEDADDIVAAFSVDPDRYLVYLPNKNRRPVAAR
ncbi:MAG: transglutaminase-like cysteine peptidase [Alphaproteobacteria bacterium]